MAYVLVWFTVVYSYLNLHSKPTIGKLVEDDLKPLSLYLAIMPSDMVRGSGPVLQFPPDRKLNRSLQVWRKPRAAKRVQDVVITRDGG